MSSFAERFGALSPEKRLLLDLLRKEKLGKAPVREAVPEKPERQPVQPFELVSEQDRRKLPSDVVDAYPLTTVQLGMLYHMEMTPDGLVPDYHNVNSFHLRAEFDLQKFQQAAQAVVARHPQLRTAFDLTGYSEPLQLVYREATLPIFFEDIQHLSEDEQWAHFRQFIREENKRLLDLSKPPLLRFHIHRRGEDTFQFTLTEPHAISDGWSITSTCAEIFQHYLALLAGEEPPSPPAPTTSYAEFVRLEREALSSEECRSFWAGKLAGATVNRLPRWPESMRKGSRVWHKPMFFLAPEVRDGLQRLVRSAAVPLKSVMLAAHMKVMGLLAGQDEVITGLTTHGRPEEAGGEQIRGLFLNTLPLRMRLPDGSWTDLVRAVFEAELELMPYRRYPLAAAQKLAGGQTLFETVFSYLHFHSVQQVVDSGKVEFLPGSSDWSVTHFPLAATFVMSPADGALQLTLEHNEQALCSQQVLWVQEWFRKVLAAMAADPQAPIHGVPFLAEAETRQLLAEWNPRPAEEPAAGCLHERFEAQAERLPGAPAVRFEEAELTYGDLEASANRLAAYLRRQGVGPGTLVGISLERSLEMIVAILGTLKAGGAYVPLDPDYPEARRSFILEDARPAVLITRHWLDAHAEEIARQSAARRPSGVDPDYPAYVIYTSGSTGQPKGVVVPHRNAFRLFTATEPWFSFDERDVWTMFHSYAFDFSVWEIWGALLHGGRLVIVPTLVSRSPEAFLELLHREQVTVLSQTPSAFRQLVRAEEASGDGGPLALREVVFGGEALEFQSLRPWFARHGDVSPRLINMYGITETTVHVTYRPVVASDLESAEGSLMGRPIPDLRVYVLNAHLQPVPVGVAGEICVGGAGVAMGYLNRPDLTATRFTPDPFGGEPGARLYRSGDLARWLPDGDLEYLGRLDHQVKIRGFRIELGEIESVLARHPGVRETMVLAREDMPGEKRLVAYVVPVSEDGPNVSELRAWVQETLPEHEVPSAFVLLEAMPLTAHGKIDRALLPAPGNLRPELETGYVAPGTPMEKALAEIWGQALGLEQVGVRDSFLELGGDSIRSIRVIAMAREKGIEITLQQLFQHQTIEALAGAVSLREGVSLPSGPLTSPFSLIPEEDRGKLPEDIEDAYPLTALQGGMLFHMALHPDLPTYHNINSFFLQCPFEPAFFASAVQKVIDRHPVLRTSFDFTTYSEPLQLVHRFAPAPVWVADLRTLSRKQQDEAIDALIAREGKRRFNLTDAPQLRFHVYQRSDDTLQLTVTENHAILDGWSLHSMLTEIFENLEAMLAGRPLPEKPVLPASLRDFVYMERQALRSEEAERYWTRALEGVTAVEVPRWPDPIIRRSDLRVRNLGVPISRETSQGLTDLARAAAVPIKTVLLAAHLKVLSLLTGRRDVLTGFTTHGRPEDLDGERALGFFLNTVPLRFEVSGATWFDLIKKTFAAEQELVPLRRYPLIALQQRFGVQQMFDANFNFVQFHVVRDMLSNRGVRSLEFKKIEETNFHLSSGFQLDALSSEVRLELNCDSTYLTEPQIQLIGAYFEQVLKSMAADPQGRQESLLLSGIERQQILVEWNDTAAEYPRDLSIPQVFARQVAIAPGATAVVFGEDRLTYAELEERSNRLANHLRALGIGLECLVGLCLERSADMIVSLLGILKAGAAYVPLDPGYPQERLKWMIEDSGVRVLVTVESLAGTLPESAAEQVCLDADRELIASRPATAPPDTGGPERLAYLIYTSGSTGRPKAVSVGHQGVLRLVCGARFADLGREQVFLLITALTFDVSAFEIWGSLLNGGQLVVPPPQAPSLEELELLLERHKVTILWLTSGLFNLVVDERPQALRGLRQLLVGGDALSVSHVRKFIQEQPDIRFINGYGPTEGTILASSYTVEDEAGLDASVPIGCPLSNTQIHILGPDLLPAPIGVPGELCIGGDGVARGYWGRPELTADKFIPDPYHPEPGRRLYRSGDLARWLPNGLVDFLGRIDQQVKIRGFRVELGEIEAALVEHPEVEQAVVTAPVGPDGNRRLAAYLVARNGGLRTTQDLPVFLRQKLPDYMIPAAYMVLDSLPLNTSGKVDRKALPELQVMQQKAEYQAPRGELERTIAAVWQEVLQVERVGVHDNFFELGGHSLLIIRAHGRLQTALSRELTAVDLFRYPTVSALAEYLSRGAGSDQARIEQDAAERGESRKIAATRQRENLSRRRAVRNG